MKGFTAAWIIFLIDDYVVIISFPFHAKYKHEIRLKQKQLIRNFITYENINMDRKLVDKIHI